MHHLVKNLKDQGINGEIRKHIREKVLNWLELGDLQYHAKVLKLLIEQPTQNKTELDIL